MIYLAKLSTVQVVEILQDKYKLSRLAISRLTTKDQYVLFQMLTSALQGHTAVALTLCAIIPRDHICAAVYPDILETGRFAKVKCFIGQR